MPAESALQPIGNLDSLLSWGGNKCYMDSSLLSPGKGKMPSRKHPGRDLGALTKPRVRFLQLEAGPEGAQPWTGLL